MSSTKSMKLETLNAEQSALIPKVKEDWVRFCLGGDTSINRELAMDGIRWIYGKAKLKSPFVIFVDGPYACQVAVWFLRAWLKNKNMAQVGDQVRDQVRDQVYSTSYWGIKVTLGLPIKHWFFDFLKLGVMIVFVQGKVKVFGKKGKFLGEYDEADFK